MSQLAVTQDRVTQVAAISGSEFVWIFAPVKVEDIVMCENGTEAWVVGIGPGPFDDALLFKITGVDTASPSVDQDSFIEFPDPYLDGAFPAGMGPRGFPGFTVNLRCNEAYFPNFFLDSVAKVDLNTKELVWPAGYNADNADEFRTLPAPVDVQLDSPWEDKLFVSSADGMFYILDSATGEQLAAVATGGVGPGSVVAIGAGYAMVVQNSQDIACIDLSTNRVSTISGLGLNPFMAVASNDGQTVYVSNQGANTVSVLSGLGCNKSVVAEIPVGNAPRHLALSLDNRYLYVSNSIDNTVSVIDTQSLSVVETIQVAAPDEPAPVGVVAVSKDNRYLYVFWEGGPKGTPGTFEIRVFDVSGLY
jgi:YVTN family beta-propeller protein